MSTSLLTVTNLHAGYGKREVLRGLSFDVKAGELVVLVGPNGAGKSTVLKVVAGLVKPTNGTVVLGGRDVTAMPIHHRAHCGIGMVLQGGPAFPSLTVAGNLEVAAAVLPPQERHAKLEEVVELLPNLRPLLGRRAGLLSGGERQALALAAALIAQPRLLLLDEPSAGLAPSIASGILNKVRTLTRTSSKAVLLVEQDLAAALPVADRVLAFIDGQLLSTADNTDKSTMQQDLVNLLVNTNKAQHNHKGRQ